MTGYYISVGYNSGFNKPEVAEKLLEVVRQIRANPQEIVKEVARVEGLGASAGLESFAEMYREPGEEGDLTIRIKEDEDSEEKLPIVVQLASSHGGTRVQKERMRRAFCRLVMEMMHREEMEVNIHVS